jgi:hypothetical protein
MLWSTWFANIISLWIINDVWRLDKTCYSFFVLYFNKYLIGLRLTTQNRFLPGTCTCICRSWHGSWLGLINHKFPLDNFHQHGPTTSSTSYPDSFPYALRWRKDPGPGWSRVSQILGLNWEITIGTYGG